MISFIFFLLFLNTILADKGIECPEGHICWPKCCAEGSDIDMDTMECTAFNLPFKQPTVYELRKNKAENASSLVAVSTNNLTPIYEYINRLEVVCDGEYELTMPNGSVNLLSNGQLYMDNGDSAEIYEEGFCLENFVITAEGHSVLAVYLCTQFAPIASFSSSLTQEELNDNTLFNQKVSTRNKVWTDRQTD
jgi:hypothetical protein